MMEIKDIRVGLKLKLNRMSEFQYLEWGRVEAIGHDWVVVRADNNTVHTLTDSDYIEMYTDEDIPLQDCESEKDWTDQNNIIPVQLSNNPVFTRRRDRE